MRPDGRDGDLMRASAAMPHDESRKNRRASRRDATSRTISRPRASAHARTLVDPAVAVAGCRAIGSALDRRGRRFIDTVDAAGREGR
jgi:hypothetical protein